MTFHTGSDEATELTDGQLLSQFKMYIAALRMADDFGLDAVGIQYQQGLKDVVPASDLVEGLLNDGERPPVRSRDGSRELYPGVPLPHFNEVDEGAAVDALVTNRVWTAMGLDPATTLHDVRWGDDYDGRFVWVFEISGSVPASHNGGYDKSWSMRQPPMYFPLGGGTLSGISKPGAVVWSRVFVMDGALHVDLGRATALALPEEETERRLAATTPQWPIMHAVLHGITPRPVHGAAQGEPPQRRLRAGRRDRRPGAAGQGRDVRSSSASGCIYAGTCAGSTACRSQASTDARCAVIQARASSELPRSIASQIARCSAIVRSIAPPSVIPRQIRARIVCPERLSSSFDSTLLPAAVATVWWKAMSFSTNSSTPAHAVMASISGAKLGQVLRCAPLGRECGRVGLEQSPRLEQVEHAAVLVQLDHERQRVEQQGGVETRDVRAVAPAHVEDADEAERTHRLAQ